MKLLMDTNIIVDHLRRREPFCAGARLLLALGKAGEFDLWISPSQLGDLFYVLSQGGKRHLMGTVASEIRGIRSFVHVCTFGEVEADRALESGWSDLEDALVFEAARALRADAIITRNQADFENPSIPVYDCEEFFSWYARTYGIDYAEVAL